MTAVSCGTPTPATMRVVQIEPGPTPIFTAEAPASMSASVPSAVATLPPTIGRSRQVRRSSATVSSTDAEWPWAVSTTTTSTPASTSACARSSRSGPTPIAAPQRSRPIGSFDAVGKRSLFSMSLIVMSPRRSPCSSTTRSFSIRCLWRSSRARSIVVPGGTVTRPSFVITVEISAVVSFTKRRSRFVRMPTAFPWRVIGTPEMR